MKGEGNRRDRVISAIRIRAFHGYGKTGGRIILGGQVDVKSIHLGPVKFETDQ